MLCSIGAVYDVTEWAHVHIGSAGTLSARSQQDLTSSWQLKVKLRH